MNSSKKVLIVCEFSGIVREAFSRLGFDAWSCDLLASEIPGKHLQQDAFTSDGEWNLPLNFDLVIAHPPCQFLACSGARWWETRQVEQRKAIWMFMAFVNAPCKRIAIENPVGLMSTVYRKPEQILQPWMFGKGETKATCIWLKNLPRLKSTNVVSGRVARVHYESPGPDRWKNRSRTHQGIADAMAKQWGAVL